MNRKAHLVRASFAYQSEHPDDLCFTEGQLINVVDEVDEDWLYGQYDMNGTTWTGIFPRNFVEEVESENDGVVADNVHEENHTEPQNEPVQPKKEELAAAPAHDSPLPLDSKTPEREETRTVEEKAKFNTAAPSAAAAMAFKSYSQPHEPPVSREDGVEHEPEISYASLEERLEEEVTHTPAQFGIGNLVTHRKSLGKNEEPAETKPSSEIPVEKSVYEPYAVNSERTSEPYSQVPPPLPASKPIPSEQHAPVPNINAYEKTPAVHKEAETEIDHIDSQELTAEEVQKQKESFKQKLNAFNNLKEEDLIHKSKEAEALSNELKEQNVSLKERVARLNSLQMHLDKSAPPARKPIVHSPANDAANDSATAAVSSEHVPEITDSEPAAHSPESLTIVSDQRMVESPVGEAEQEPFAYAAQNEIHEKVPEEVSEPEENQPSKQSAEAYENDDEEADEEEEEEDPEEARRRAIRERVAKLSGGFGMNMPFVLPGMGGSPKTRKKPSKKRSQTAPKEDETTRAPPVPIFPHPIPSTKPVTEEETPIDTAAVHPVQQHSSSSTESQPEPPVEHSKITKSPAKAPADVSSDEYDIMKPEELETARLYRRLSEASVKRTRSRQNSLLRLQSVSEGKRVDDIPLVGVSHTNINSPSSQEPSGGAAFTHEDVSGRLANLKLDEDAPSRRSSTEAPGVVRRKSSMKTKNTKPVAEAPDLSSLQNMEDDDHLLDLIPPRIPDEGNAGNQADVESAANSPVATVVRHPGIFGDDNDRSRAATQRLAEILPEYESEHEPTSKSTSISRAHSRSRRANIPMLSYEDADREGHLESMDDFNDETQPEQRFSHVINVPLPRTPSGELGDVEFPLSAYPRSPAPKSRLSNQLELPTVAGPPKLDEPEEYEAEAPEAPVHHPLPTPPMPIPRKASLRKNENNSGSPEPVFHTPEKDEFFDAFENEELQDAQALEDPEEMNFQRHELPPVPKPTKKNSLDVPKVPLPPLPVNTKPQVVADSFTNEKSSESPEKPQHRAPISSLRRYTSTRKASGPRPQVPLGRTISLSETSSSQAGRPALPPVPPPPTNYISMMPKEEEEKSASATTAAPSLPPTSPPPVPTAAPTSVGRKPSVRTARPQPPAAPAPAIPSNVHPANAAPPAPTTPEKRASRNTIVTPFSDSFVAKPIDPELNTAWWSRPSVFPDSANALRSQALLKSMSEDHGDYLRRIICILFRDYSKTVITASYERSQPNVASIVQKQVPPPSQPSKDNLEQAHVLYGQMTARKAKLAQGTVVDDGSAFAFVNSVYRTLDRCLLPIGKRSYGAIVYQNMANATVQQYDEIRPGDIVTFRNVRLQGQKGALHQRYSLEVGKPDHVAIVFEWDGTKRKIRAYEQGRESKKVNLCSYRFGDLKSGEITVWRIMPASWVNWS
ncbi:hypothetical protein SJAG_02202 [Schizosaccharomyces japonicus yFS275]|uniref:SH3 domain-containing protein n=1 Tax=Schizosaccharomyces japonicus (strain yFS275 / FY16936) TaxID=402676 RepID=B6K1U0_SCHJY|nr:hypothetical protein SJAG_02202 [Schizosaccharomyces japonicus yFS275]EEB07121.1 hypothetical protein SJAG_02202 [Schizosaccharomyces japonicus yFS275]